MGSAEMKNCIIELQDKINEHRKDGIMCNPDCWCWPAQGIICLYLSAIEANRILLEQNPQLRKASNETYT